MAKDKIKVGKALPPAESAVVRKLYYEDGLTLDEIGKQVGCSRQCLARWMEYWGFQRKGHGQAAHAKRKRLGLRGPNWKGGHWWSASQRLWYTYAPHHPKARHHGGIPTHVLVAEERIGRPTTSDEVIHHLDEDRDNNTAVNLCVMLRGEHMLLHRVLGNVGIALLLSGEGEKVLGTITDEATRKFVAAVYTNREPCVSGRLADYA